MDALTGIGMISGVLKGASELVRELKQPKLSEATFADLLKQQIQQTQPAQQEKRIQHLSEKFVQLHDVNGDGLVSADESGLSSELFAHLDQDGDGQLSVQELQQTAAEKLSNL